jgi:hypothetical protein
MSTEAFATLVDLLRPMLEVDPIRLGSHEPIIPEIAVATGLRYLGGSHYKEFDETLGISLASAREVILWVGNIQGFVDAT